MRGAAHPRVRGVLAALGLLLFLPAAASAAQPKPVADALAMLDSGIGRLASGWRYQQKATSDKGTETLAYDAARPAGQRWKVLKVNGKPPTAKQARKLAEQASAAHKKGKQSATVAIGVGSWLQASTYRLIHSDPKQLVYQVSMHPGPHDSASAREMLKHLSGRLVVSRDDHRPLKLTLENYEAFSPRFAVKVTRFDLEIAFKRLGSGKDAPVVADHISTEAKGKVFWLKGFDTHTEVTLSHFAPVAGSAPAPAPASR